MTSPQKWVLASNNQGKLAEFQRLLAPLHIELLAQSTFNISPCPEPHPTFVENAIDKARHASRISMLPALADDSGICAPALNGVPGIYSARYAGEQPKSDTQNNQKLSDDLSNHTNQAVYYACVLVFVLHPEDPLPIIAEATWHGQWQVTAKGTHGFGYDPHFYLPHLHKTVAELTPSEKNQLSHRAQAFKILLDKLAQHRGYPALDAR